MTPTETQAIQALMQLFPPHPTGFGKLSGFKLGTQAKNQWTEKTQATQQDYLHHLTADQTEPHGIGQYAKQGDVAHWLCFDIDVKGEQGRHIAFLLLEELEARGCIPYLEESTRGGFHAFLWPENKSIFPIFCET